MSVPEYNSYFAAANTESGFKSFFEEIFFAPSIKRRYIIKGGPGTGKSSLMKKYVRSAAEKGHTAELYYCSSDTSSLDGVVLDGEVAIFDGTAPHSHDTVLPGAVDSIINLGEYWNGELLRSRRAEIEELSQKKSGQYGLAYECLSAYGSVCALADKIIEKCTDKDKLAAAAHRLLLPYKGRGGTAKRQVRQVSALGVRGQVHFDTLCRLATERVYIEDYYGSAALLFECLASTAEGKGYTVYLSYAVPRSAAIEELYLPEAGLWLGVGKPDGGARTVKMKRFVRAGALAEVRCELRALLGSARVLHDLAASHLARAGELHASIEKYYVIAMDFERMQGAAGVCDADFL